MKCPKCDKEIPDKAKFCTKCGANVDEEKKKIEEKAAEEAKKKEENRKKEEEKKKAEEARKKEEEKKKETEETKKQEEKKKAEEKDKKAEEKKNVEEIKKDLKKEMKKEVEKKVEKEVKKETKKKKSHWKAKLITTLIIVLIIVFGISYFLYRAEMLPESVRDVLLPVYELIDGWIGKEDSEEKDEEKKDETKEENKVEEPEIEEDKIKLKDEKEELVYDLYNKTMFGNEYKLPKINLDYKNVDKINEEIEDLLDDLEIKKLEKESELPEGAIGKVDYIWYKNRNILSVVIYVQNYHTDDYHVYNIDVETGEEIENKDILDAAKINEDIFAMKCSEAVENYYTNYLYSADIAKSAGKVYEDAKEESIDENNFRISSIDMFLDNMGRVNIVTEITTIAGAGYNDVIINIENLKSNAKSLFSTKQSEVKVDNTENEKEDNTTNSINTTKKDKKESTNSTDNNSI